MYLRKVPNGDLLHHFIPKQTRKEYRLFSWAIYGIMEHREV